jgi:hypothetical protein
MNETDAEVERVAELVYSASAQWWIESQRAQGIQVSRVIKPFGSVLARAQDQYRAIARAVIADRKAAEPTIVEAKRE